MGTYTHVKKSRRQRKQLLVDYLGGKCVRCGYSLCLDALDFHHIDKTKKDFHLSKKWECFDRCIEEVKKCILLCSNCHRELHAGLWDVEEIDIPTPDYEIVKEYLNRFKVEIVCCCGKSFVLNKSQTKKYCSESCRRKASRRVERPNKNILKKQIKELGYVGTAKIYGVSDNAVRKWYCG